jgi:hypothetical protein
MNKDKQHVHTCPCCMPMSMLNVRVPALCQCPCCMSLSMMHVLVHAACPCPCCLFKSMQHGHGHAAGTWHAAKTWARSIYWDMQYGHGHPAWTWTCSMNMDMQHEREHGQASHFIWFPFYSLRICYIRFRSYSFRFYSLHLIFVSALFASIHFLSYSFRILNFLIRFEANISESNPLIRYFAEIYSIPNSLIAIFASKQIWGDTLVTCRRIKRRPKPGWDESDQWREKSRWPLPNKMNFFKLIFWLSVKTKCCFTFQDYLNILWWQPCRRRQRRSRTDGQVRRYQQSHPLCQVTNPISQVTNPFVR